MNSRIQSIRAIEVLDSRGDPTVSAEIQLADGTIGEASVPAGASKGSHEAAELRDHDPARYRGRGVLKAVANVNTELARSLTGMDATDQASIDRRMIEIDGTPDKSRLGANAILAVSCAVARAAANIRGIPLWRHLAAHRAPVLPVPMVNILSGGLHASGNFEFQDFLVVPRGFSAYREALRAIVAIHRATRDVLRDRGFQINGVADEGGWGPKLPTNQTALEILTASVERAGFVPKDQIAFAIDVASTHFWSGERYILSSEGRSFNSEEMIHMLDDWSSRYPIVSIEDPLSEDDWEGWQRITARLGRRVQLVGDDLFATNLPRLERGISSRAANAILVKMNQAGTLTETFNVIDRARAAGYSAVISARSGETEDPFLADLAIASGAGQIKVGSVRTSERLSKYNRLLKLERELPWGVIGC